MNRVRSFKILNHLIKVLYPRTIKGNLLGTCEPDKCSLKVKAGTYPGTTIEHSRWHEQVHLMFYFAGRMDLYEDETLVDALAGYLAQYESTVVRK